MKLFVNGCSFSYGGSIFPLYDEDHRLVDFNSKSQINRERLNSVWSHHLGKHLNAESVTNLGLCSSSNDRIVRSTVEYITNTSNTDDLFVVIQWSNPDRFEFYDEINRGWIQIAGSSSWIFFPDDPNFDFTVQNGAYAKKIQKKLDIFYKNFYSEYQASVRSLLNFELLGNYLKNRNIKYLFCLLTYGLFDKIKTEDKYLENKIQQISDSHNWLNGSMDNSTLNALIYKKNMSTDTGHPDLNGHKQIGLTLYNYIINNLN